MKYILDRRYRLRGWHKLPTGLYDTLQHEAQFFAPESYRLLLHCDGDHEIDTAGLPDKQRELMERMLDDGIVRPSGWLDFLLPEQQYKTYPARYRREVHWSVTGECNLQCRHCFMSAPAGKYGSPSYEEIVRVADMLAQCGVFRVGLTGGEPLIRSDLLRILDALAEREIALTIIYTNGWLVDKRLLDALEERGMHPNFQLSFDGVGCHDFLRGMPRPMRQIPQRLYWTILIRT